MMKYLLLVVFLIPTISNWWLLMFMVMASSFIYIYLNIPLSYLSLVSNCFGSDILSYSLIGLSFWLVFLMIMSSFVVLSSNRLSLEFLFILLLLLIILVITFSVDNLILFYLAFESSIIPTLFLIFGWGYQPERLMAGYYLLFYTLFASLPMLLGIVYIYFTCFTLNFWIIYLDVNFYLYLSMILAFLFKLPMTFVHFWLPKAHVEAPVSGSMVLAGILLKLGGYGLFRIFLFTGNFLGYSYLFISLSLFGSFMVGLLCLSQSDIKSLIAYSSVSHMALVISGLMTYNYYGFVGSLILMLGHGFCSSAMFCLANLIYERTHSRSLMINKGLIVFIPGFSLLMFLLCINNMASPPSLNLLGEIYIIVSVVGWDYINIVFLMFSSFLSCCYSIYLFSMTQHGAFYSGFYKLSLINIREYMLILLHFIPLNFLFLNFSGFCLFI